MKKTIFIKNAGILTVSSLLLRFIGIVFKVWLAAKIGAEGIGLYQLTFSLYMLAATFATSGLSTAVTRLVTDELALGSKRGTLKILRRCVEITLIIAFISLGVLFFGGDFIAERLLGDIRTALSIKVLGISLPFMGVCSCIRGYFIARRKATPNALSQLLEQAVRIFTVFIALKLAAGKGLAILCAAVLLGDTVAEAFSAVMMWIIFLFDTKKLNALTGRARPPYKIVKAVGHIAFPITLGRYLNTALRTVENILVPRNLAKYRLSGENALSQFGMIKGMALPILFFPSTLLNAISTLLIPEMSEARARCRNALVRDTVGKVLQITGLISFIFAALFFVGGDKLGFLIYKSDDVGFLLRALAPIVPFMYLDSISDGLLKGLDCQKFTFRTSVADSALRIAAILAVLPHFGLNGFIWIMYFSNLLTCTLNVGKLIKVSGAAIDMLKSIILPLGGAVTIALICDTVISLIPSLPILVYTILICAVALPIYTAFLFTVGSVTTDDIKDIIG